MKKATKMKTSMFLSLMIFLLTTGLKVRAGTGPDACNFTDSKNQVWAKVGNSSTTGDGYQGICLSKAEGQDRYQFISYLGVLEPNPIGPEFRQEELYDLKWKLKELQNSEVLRQIPRSEVSLSGSLRIFLKFFANTLAPVTGDEQSRVFSAEELDEIVLVIEFTRSQSMALREVQSPEESGVLYGRIIHRANPSESIEFRRKGATYSWVANRAGSYPVSLDFKINDHPEFKRVIERKKARTARWGGKLTGKIYAWEYGEDDDFEAFPAGLTALYILGSTVALFIHPAAVTLAIFLAPHALPLAPVILGSIAQPFVWTYHLPGNLARAHHERRLDKKLLRAIQGESTLVSSDDFELLIQKLFSSLPNHIQPMNPNGGAPW
jgi:hypothetical protein